MIRAFIFSLIGSLIFVLGCTESPDISTQTPYPTYTPSATFTPYPTQTPYPTYSPQPIPTNTATATIPVIALALGPVAGLGAARAVSSHFSIMVEEISQNSLTKFLVITHHRMTMARVNRLFGVTMPEKGVSQLVSVDLEKAVQIRENEL